MKKCICVAMVMLLIVAFTGCVGKDATNNNEVVCDHTYNASTCLKHPQCTKCGYESGSYGMHSYEDGVCVYCNVEDPDWEPRILTGSEYDRVNSLMQGTFKGQLNTGNRIEYHFEDGSFACYTELGGTILENYGTYALTEKSLILYYQNGTEKSCPWEINENGEIVLYLLDLK